MNWVEFFAMKGYGLYVWGSYGAVLFVLVLEIMLVRHRRSLTLRQLRLKFFAENQMRDTENMG